MAERSYPFVHDAGSTTTQGTTTDAEYSMMVKQWVEDGVVGSSSDIGLRPYANSSGLKVMVPAGMAFVRGHFYSNVDLKTLVIAAGGSQVRIDSVILKLEYGGVNQTVIQVKQGLPASNPQPASLIQTDTGVFELLLATVTVPANASTITAANVVDQRSFTGIRAISQGGTGANTADGARAALGINVTAYAFGAGMIGGTPPADAVILLQVGALEVNTNAAGEAYFPYPRAFPNGVLSVRLMRTNMSKFPPTISVLSGEQSLAGCDFKTWNLAEVPFASKVGVPLTFEATGW